MRFRKLSKKDAKEIALLCGLVGALLVVFLVVGRGLENPKRSAAQQPYASYAFPNGGRQIFPDYRLVSLYGAAGDPALGALGEQGIAESIARAKALAVQYQPLMTEHAYPALEMLATVAAGSPTANNDYSREVVAKNLQPWIKAARDAGVYVVLDLQPGRSSFLTQAKEYQALLEQPNVGLALDPEWRLQADQQPLKQVGSVSIDEVNETVNWLAKLTADNKLPQKLLVLHQFQLSMLPNRDKLNTSHSNLAYVIQMDGQGTQDAKASTWRAITANPPPNLKFGWKNFYTEDSPMLDPAATMALTPKPWYVSYQ